MERKMSAMACAVFNELRLEGKLCDVIINVDGNEFKAHKNILCSCSQYFRALFTSSWNNAEKIVYNIPGTSPKIMKLIIEYAYTRTIPVTADNVESLLIAADQFNIMGIIRLCCEFLKSQLCLENCIGICRFTDHYHCPDLREAAFEFIFHHFGEMTRASTEFLDLSIDELVYIIEKDELNVRQEDIVFEAVMKWIAHDPQNRRQHVAVLLSKVRLALMDADYFMNKVKTHDYVKDNKDCKPLIRDTLTEMYNLNMHGPSYYDFANPLSQPRLPCAVLFAIGGWSTESPTNAIEIYDNRADKWMNVTCEQESPLAYHGTAYLQGFIYVIGGFDSTNYFNSVKRFHPLRKVWQQVAPMHSRRCYVSVTVLDNFIYAMGGFDGHSRLRTAERYKPETNQWTLIAPMHEERSDASATTLHGKVYICGGFNGNECLMTAEAYDVTTNQWTLIAQMRSRRSGVGVMAYGNAVYAVGGFDGVERLPTAEAYNPVANTWHAVPTMFNPRSNFGIEVVDDLLFVVGGFNGSATTFKVECYDENTNEWHDVQNMNIHRSALSCCVVPGLSNVREYAGRRDYYMANVREVRFTASTSSLPM
ncbi:PREDICTED: kelch-like protein 10 [Tauraco erythrolophus]|uniref:kelch-like protein 10 n=1 Tax=Tauraco erythrolophus TaxID=121530 RepID=UPI000523EBC4|nr:PREDICTED: kelch-like protein 10 [Tauraco erythrolophus]